MNVHDISQRLEVELKAHDQVALVLDHLLQLLRTHRTASAISQALLNACAKPEGAIDMINAYAEMLHTVLGYWKATIQEDATHRRLAERRAAQ